MKWYTHELKPTFDLNTINLKCIHCNISYEELMNMCYDIHCKILPTCNEVIIKNIIE